MQSPFMQNQGPQLACRSAMLIVAARICHATAHAELSRKRRQPYPDKTPLKVPLVMHGEQVAMNYALLIPSSEAKPSRDRALLRTAHSASSRSFLFVQG